MSSIEALALSLLVSQHTADLSRQAKLEELLKLQEENAKLKAAQRAAHPPKAKSKAAPIQSAPEMKGMLRSPTVESSRAFLVASRKARTLGESKLAIDQFIGYDHAGNFGAQDTRARMVAQTTIKPVSTAVPTKEEQLSAARSLAGFVHGLPDHLARTLDNLRGQAEKAAEAMIEAEKTGDQVKAAIERERLYGESGIYAQIRQMGFEI
jgi:hypothetical protein